MINYSIAVQSTKPGTKTADIKETKAYGKAQISEIMTLQDFSRHIASHGCVYKRADVQAILILMVDCLREMLLDGKKVQLGDLGSFSVGIVTNGATTAAAFNENNIKDVKLNWSRGTLFKNLIEDAVFNQVASRSEQEKGLAEDKKQETIIKTGFE